MYYGTGDLNKRITIQTLTHTTDSDGFPIDEWLPFKTVWAKQSNLSGREYFAAMAVQAEKTEKFGIRYMKDLDETINTYGADTIKMFRIKYGNAILNITFINSTNDGFMELKALSEVV